MMWGYAWWPGMAAMMVSGLIWLGLAIVAIWALVRWASRGSAGSLSVSNPPHDGPSAMELLRRRYARGEIDAATFDEMRSRLDSAPGAVTERQPVAR